MRPGRSRASVLLLARPSVHCFAWAPWLGADSYGMAVRVRRDGQWRHFRVAFWQLDRARHARMRQKSKGRRGRVLVRRTRTLAEASWWRSGPGVNERVGTKGYLRLKASAAGRPLE